MAFINSLRISLSALGYTLLLLLGGTLIQLLLFSVLEHLLGSNYAEHICTFLTQLIIAIILIVFVVNKNDLKSKYWAGLRKSSLSTILILAGIALILEAGKSFILYELRSETITTVRIIRLDEVIWTMVAAVFFAPFVEEVFFRRFIQAFLLKNQNVYWAILFSSLLFSIYHIPIVVSMLDTFVFGILSGIILFRTRKIYYCIIFHFFANFFWAIELLIFEGNWLTLIN
jgi:membrane protease YdiL (CAAX protease family)